MHHQTVVLYEPTVSSIVEASKVGGKDSIYAHLSEESVKVLARDADNLVVVVENEHASMIAKKAADNYVSKVRIVKSKKKWYADYVYRHLIEPRMKDVLTADSIDEYAVVLKAEYKTIEMCKKILTSVVPRKVGDFTYVVVPRLPTADVSATYYKKYGTPVLVASLRDVGIAWSAIADKNTTAELARRFSRIGYVDSEPGVIVSGFIYTYPESPKAYLPLIEEVLQSVRASPPESVRLSRTVEAVMLVDGLIDYLRFKAKSLLWSLSRTMIMGDSYMVVNCGNPSPYYASMLDNNVCTIMFYLPPPNKIAVATPFIPKEIRSDRAETKVSPLTITSDSRYLTIIPKHIVKDIKHMIEKYGKAAVVVS